MSQLHSKSFTVTQELARYFLSININERILTISEFEENMEVARGTIQNSLQILKDAKAISLSSRGKLGTFIESSNDTLLMKFANIDFLVGVMPLPYSKTYEGLSSGILQELNSSLKIPVNMAYMRGAQKRLDLVASGRYDFAIVSKFAALEYINKPKSTLKICLDFMEYSYLHGHSLLFANKEHSKIESGMRVGIDYDSIDQVLLTQLVTKGIQVQLVPLNYTQFERSLASNEIDAVVWNIDEITPILMQFNIVRISDSNNLTTSAVLVVDQARKDLSRIFQANTSIDSILKTQNRIRSGLQIPQY